MLAYVFWHRPRPGADAGDYEDAQRAFHASLAIQSACFRLVELPFVSGPGYEDWYLVEGWEELGDLNEAAVAPPHRPHHDRAAATSGDGWGGVYGLVRGEAAIPAGIEWLEKPRDQPSAKFLDSLPETMVWQRQMVLGPGPEFCLAVPASAQRQPIAPAN